MYSDYTRSSCKTHAIPRCIGGVHYRRGYTWKIPRCRAKPPGRARRRAELASADDDCKVPNDIFDNIASSPTAAGSTCLIYMNRYKCDFFSVARRRIKNDNCGSSMPAHLVMM
ncbi:hypothetical protein EVAR_50199_1 [Eumeta japonica]|uniref:Uncharacterized protein n=1 Tax=Eumeta variegata TaxID=151549 RepID=A0A4C1WY06_EUMVA|nr:hypothetical protein EVAR_50199_1 [Eumeta japonica]